jgi:hypothetical protein
MLRRKGEEVIGEFEGEFEGEYEKSFFALIRNGGEGSMAGFLTFNFDGEVQTIVS